MPDSFRFDSVRLCSRRAAQPDPSLDIGKDIFKPVMLGLRERVVGNPRSMIAQCPACLATDRAIAASYLVNTHLAFHL